jgi:type I restriction enzyme M protein
MDLRRWGSEFEKKFIELTTEDIEKISDVYHSWQQKNWRETYKDVPEFCYSASIDEIKEKDFSLIPSKYIPLKELDRSLNFHDEMTKIQEQLTDILAEEIASQKDLIDAFGGLGYEIKV